MGRSKFTVSAHNFHRWLFPILIYVWNPFLYHKTFKFLQFLLNGLWRLAISKSKHTMTRNADHACATLLLRMRELAEVMKLKRSWYWYLHNFEGVICILWLSNLRIIRTSCLLEHSTARDRSIYRCLLNRLISAAEFKARCSARSRPLHSY